jgi:hypothetical protein
MPKAWTQPSPMMKEEKSKSMMGERGAASEAKPAEAPAEAQAQAPAPAA